MGRSRSPHRNLSTRRISKAIVTFGRWPKRRPTGLYVDEKGSFMLNELMQCWGSDEGLSRYEVLDALQEHKYNERNGYKRFGILRVPSMDDYVITVYDKEYRDVKSRCGGIAPWKFRRRHDWKHKPKHDDDETHDKDLQPMYHGDEDTNYKVPEPMFPDGGETDPEPMYPDEKDPLWVQYEDLHNKGKTWWYYQGPLGKWFMRDDDMKPEPWWDDSCDFEEEHHINQHSDEEGLHMKA